ncbi:MAG: segregation/condensation protein A [Sandaracinaceae bacterium]|jgi:segregation and condensation protein A|nr:segregation/condensation protein A [Sandaracinaceae bacterium]MBP7682602.1 segregation/condensation protein A [Deltaproteobacteria bacterium]MBK6808589.1 segregation/condensation protein A [Sandaracinaceae bacterium]MBK7150160.1 segregation/condensation protein A [Sandaracinaceae bacterium]MBK7774228.1 segregation/condensation protein A [Sandaracinaceae bacterium]
MSADPPLALDPNFRIELPNFEGPLDLLLYLVQKHELNVLDLPIAFVTERYLAYISVMQSLNLDIAAEYLVMAATLAHIKSKMLLPKPPEDQDDDPEEELDPRAELIRRLLEYQKYKQVAEELGARGVAGRDVFKRGAPGESASGEPPLASLSLFKLIDAFQKIAKRVQGEVSLEVDAERITIQERMNQVVDILNTQVRCRFEQLFEGLTTRYDLVVTFLALLEMAKMQRLRIYQSDPEAPIHLEYREAPADGTLEDPNEQGTPWRPSSDDDHAVGVVPAAAWEPEDAGEDYDESLDDFGLGEEDSHDEDEDSDDEVEAGEQLDADELSLHDPDGAPGGADLSKPQALDDTDDASEEDL